MNQTIEYECLREENRCLREKLYQIQELMHMERQEVSVGKWKYEPSTYDEAIALSKGWTIGTVDRGNIGKIYWRAPRNSVPCKLLEWEAQFWPDLIKEMNEINCSSGESLDFSLTWNAYSLKWLCSSSVYPFLRQFDEESFGGAVCGAYLRLKGHKDWADRLCK